VRGHGIAAGLNHGSDVALLIEHFSEWNRDDCDGVNGVRVASAVVPLETDKVSDLEVFHIVVSQSLCHGISELLGYDGEVT